MHAQILLLGWLLTGQLTPTTEFAPNVTIPRPGQSSGRFGPPADSTPLMGAEEEVQLQPVPESSPGVEFTPQSLPPRARNELRVSDYGDDADRVAVGGGVSHSSFAGTRPVAQLLIKHGLTPPDTEAARMTGHPVSLVTLLDRVSDQGQRMTVIRAYWSTMAELALANWAAEEVEFTQTLPAENGGADQAEIENARLDALARWQEARLATVTAQHELARASRLQVTTDDSLPLPRDLPLVTAYTTKFERIFAGRTPPPTVRQLAATIPLQFELVETRATSVSTGRETLKAVRQAYQQRTADLALLLSAQHRLDESQRAFLQVVRRYNESVAAYALEIGGAVDNPTLVTMLIPMPTGLRGGSASQTPRLANVPGGRSSGFTPGRTMRGPIDSAEVRASGEYMPNSPRGATNWAPAMRPGDTASDYETPPVTQPSSRFGGP